MESSHGLQVTILITTYNYAHFLERAIESALRQEYAGPSIQILVVDDGSTDETASVAGRYGDRIRYIAKENGGQASALNVGFAAAKGDIICLLDGDDYFYPGKVGEVAGLFERHAEVGLVYDEFDLVDRTGKSLEKARPEPTWTGCRIPLHRIPDQIRSLILLGHPWTCITSAMSVRRTIMTGLTVPEEVFPHSPDLFLGLVLPFMSEVAIAETPGTAYVYHGNNVGLFRSSDANRALYARQMEYIRRYIEERFSVRFPCYGGRSMYGPCPDAPSRRDRVRTFIREYREISAAHVDPVVTRRSRVKLAASFLLSDVPYNKVRQLRAAYGTWQMRQFRQRIAAAGGKEEPSD